VLQGTLTIVVSLSCLVVLSVYPFVLLPRSIVTTCSSLITNDDFLQKCAGNTPESKILHLKFQKKISEVKPRSLLWEGETPSRTSPRSRTVPPIVPNGETWGSQG